MSISFNKTQRCSALAVLSAVVFVPALFSQSYSPLYAPQSQVSGAYGCFDQNDQPIPGASFSITPGVYAGTNAHFHATGSSGTTEPISNWSPTSGTADSHGAFQVTVTTTLIGQAEFIDIKCSSGGVTIEGIGNYAVGYGDVYYNDHPDIWIKTGGSETGGDTGHGTTAYNRYMQVTPPGVLNTGPAYFLFYATQEYLSNHPSVSQICTNDMALPFGGKFDINAINSKNQPWMSPHLSHDRGTAADVAGPGSGQCPAANQVVISDFLAACVDNGGSRAHSVAEGSHAHCNFADPASYPH